MKQITLIMSVIILSVFSKGIYSQNSWQIIDTSSKWSVITNYGGYYDTHFIRFSNEDTLIEGFSYRKVYNTYDPDEQNWSFMDLFIREDTLTRQVFLRNPVGEEGMIYDFSIGVCDTVTINNVISGGFIKMEVIEIDSILINEVYRKRFHFEPINWPYWDTWVEGIGSMGQGIIYSGFYNTGSGYTLLCHKYNDTLYYINPNYTACYYPYVSVYETYADNYKVSYNSNTNCIHVNGVLANGQAYFELYSVFGQRILHLPIADNAQINLGKYGLKDGPYIYSIKDKKYNNNGKLMITKK